MREVCSLTFNDESSGVYFKTNLSTQLWIYLLRVRIFLYPRKQLTLVAVPCLDLGECMIFSPCYFPPFFQPWPQIEKLVANFVGYRVLIRGLLPAGHSKPSIIFSPSLTLSGFWVVYLSLPLLVSLLSSPLSFPPLFFSSPLSSPSPLSVTSFYILFFSIFSISGSVEPSCSLLVLLSDPFCLILSRGD